MRRFVKRAASQILYVVYLVAALAVADYVFFYRPYVGKLRGHTYGEMPSGRDPATARLAAVPHVEERVMGLVGKVEVRKRSSFTYFPKEKAPGTIRICTHGDSHTAGDEVDDGYDYPALLAKLVEEEAEGRVEVLNFGVGGYGFHQSYILWDHVARHFECDYHLLGPRGFQPRRDTTFGFIYSWSPYYLHARYVLDGHGDVALVEVPGETYGERFDHHFRFLQPWRYLRYSRNPPIFLKSLIPEDRTLSNPFYYDRRSSEAEAAEIAGILISKMAREGAEIVLGVHRGDVVDLGASLAADNVSSARFHEAVTFPYLAPNSHAGPQGNLFLARQFLAQLTGAGEGMTVLVTGEFDRGALEPDTGRKRALSSYSEITFEIEGVSLGRFVVNDSRYRPLQTDAFLAISGPSESVIDGCFAPFAAELRPGAAVTLRVDFPEGVRQYPLGEVVLVGGGLNIGVVKAEGFEFLSYKDIKHLQDDGVLTPLTHGKPRSRGLLFRGNADVDVGALASKRTRVSVEIDGRPLLEGEPSDLEAFRGYWLEPAEGGPCRVVRARANSCLELSELPDSGVIDLVAEHWEDGVVRVAMATWEKSVLDAPRVRRPVGRKLAVETTTAAEPR